MWGGVVVVEGESEIWKWVASGVVGIEGRGLGLISDLGVWCQNVSMKVEIWVHGVRN